MTRFRRILVAIEPSRGAASEPTCASQQALAKALWLASRTGAKLTILSTVDVSLFNCPAMREQLGDAQRQLTLAAYDVAERCITHANEKGIQATSKVLVGIPAQEICRHARSENYDLVIVGTREKARRSRTLFGSTGMRLLRNCPIPVWITPQGSKGDRFNIVVPTDFGVSSREAVRLVANLGRLTQSRVHLLHVQDRSIGLPTWSSHVSSRMAERYLAARSAEAGEKLHKQLAEMGQIPSEMEVQMHIVRGSPDEEILRAIDQLDASLVVLGMTARSAMGRAVLGETTERLLAHTRCSLLALKPPGFQCPDFVGLEHRRTANGSIHAASASVLSG
jgi:nucleotide-binding universal stress UspA family protein